MWKRDKKRAAQDGKITACVPQTYEPALIRQSEILRGDLYAALRESIPVIDAAINRLVRLLGSFEIKCEDENCQKMLDSFIKCVNIDGNSNGLAAFAERFLDRLLTYGTAVVELVPYRDYDGFSLWLPDSRYIELMRNPKNPIKIDICRRGVSGPEPFKYEELLKLAVLDPKPGALKGTSLLDGLPFVSGILMNIYECIGKNWERAGKVRYAVSYIPSDGSDRAFARERTEQIAREWQKAMAADSVRDFISVGDVKISVIGSDNPILDSNIPVRQLLEQIVAKLGVPPFLLGLNWSTTERQAEMQTDLLTSMIDSYRRIITPVLEWICHKYLCIFNKDCNINVEWEDVTMLDRVAEARAENLEKA